MSAGAKLLDVNVLVAFLWPDHDHHLAARTWFAQSGMRGWATCPITELGSVRILASPGVTRGAITPATAMTLLREFIAYGRHTFWPDDIGLSDSRFAATIPYLRGQNQLTDRYLITLALAHDGTLATFDRAVTVGLPAGSPLHDHVEVIDV